MVEKKDYYEVLGVAKNASPDDLKAAYKRLAKQLHPDVSADPKAKLAESNSKSPRIAGMMADWLAG